MEKKYYYLLNSTTVTLAVVTQGKSYHNMFMSSNRPIRFNILQADVQSSLLGASYLILSCRTQLHVVFYLIRSVLKVYSNILTVSNHLKWRRVKSGTKLF